MFISIFIGGRTVSLVKEAVLKTKSILLSFNLLMIHTFTVFYTIKGVIILS